MALFKRGSAWWIDVTSPDGRRIRESTKIADKKLAQQYHDKVKLDLWNEHRLGIKPDRLFSEAADLFLKEKSLRRSVECYESQLAWWKKQFAGKTVRQITQELIIETIDRKRDSGASSATCNRYLAVLRGTLRLICHKYRWIDAPPKFFMYEEPKGRVRWLKPDEITRLLTALPEHTRDMVRFSLATGLRQSNVRLLRWDQVDLARRTLTISGEEMKNGRDFTIPLSDEAVCVLRDNVGRHDAYVFAYCGRPVTQISNANWKAALARAGIEDFRWHDLRHTWATMMAQSGVPTDALQILGAWESPEMVKRYAHHSVESLRRHIGAADEPVREAMARLRHSPSIQHLKRVA